mgnify:CR=1 FL=1
MAVTEAQPGGASRLIVRQLVGNTSVVIGGVIVAAMVLIALFAPFLDTHDPAEINPSYRNKTPGFEATIRDDEGKKVPVAYRFGTDSLGRDIYTLFESSAASDVYKRQVIGLTFATLIGGVVVTESVFTLPGLGLLTVDAVLARDYPTIQTVILLFSLAYVVVNLLVDLAYTPVSYTHLRAHETRR